MLRPWDSANAPTEKQPPLSSSQQPHPHRPLLHRLPKHPTPPEGTQVPQLLPHGTTAWRTKWRTAAPSCQLVGSPDRHTALWSPLHQPEPGVSPRPSGPSPKHRAFSPALISAVADAREGRAREEPPPQHGDLTSETSPSAEPALPHEGASLRPQSAAQPPARSVASTHLPLLPLG